LVLSAFVWVKTVTFKSKISVAITAILLNIEKNSFALNSKT
jgi:hypothetical protein